MRKFIWLVFLTTWLIWISGPAITGPIALRHTNKPPLYYIVTGIVTGFVAYIQWIEEILRSILIGDTLTRGP